MLFLFLKNTGRKLIIMSINLENMTAVQNKNQEGILGHLMWYSVGKQLIGTDELKTNLFSPVWEKRGCLISFVLLVLSVGQQKRLKPARRLLMQGYLKTI